MSNKFFRVFSVLLFSLFVFGCDGDTIKTISVTGKVTYQGQAVEGATVTFSPKGGSGSMASGRTDPQGVYTLTTPGASKPGAVPGEYVVLIRKIESQGGSGAEYDAIGGPVETSGYAQTKITDVLPVEYSKKETTTLNATVPEGGPLTLDWTLE